MKVPDRADVFETFPSRNADQETNLGDAPIGASPMGDAPMGASPFGASPIRYKINMVGINAESHY